MQPSAKGSGELASRNYVSRNAEGSDPSPLRLADETSFTEARRYISTRPDRERQLA